MPSSSPASGTPPWRPPTPWTPAPPIFLIPVRVVGRAVDALRVDRAGPVRRPALNAVLVFEGRILCPTSPRRPRAPRRCRRPRRPWPSPAPTAGRRPGPEDHRGLCADPRPPDRLAEWARSNSSPTADPSTTSCRSPASPPASSSSRLSSSAADAPTPRDLRRSSSSSSSSMSSSMSGRRRRRSGGRGAVVVGPPARRRCRAGRSSSIGRPDALVAVVRDVLGPTSATPSPLPRRPRASSGRPPGGGARSASVFSPPSLAHLPRQLLVRSHLLELPLGHPVRQHPRLLRSLLAHEPVRIPLRLYPRSLFFLSLAPGVRHHVVERRPVPLAFPSLVLEYPRAFRLFLLHAPAATRRPDACPLETPASRRGS